MSNQTSFQPMGQTFVANVASTIAQSMAVTADAPCNQFRIYSPSGDVFIRISDTAGNSVVTVPKPGTPSYGIPIEQGTISIISGWQSGPNSNLTISMVNQSNSASAILVYVTPGEGII